MEGEADKRSLRAVAEQLALSEVQNMFSDPMHLENLVSIKEEYERKLFTAETQLEAGQQAQLDDMANAVNLLEMSRAEMRRIQKSFEVIRTKCYSCTTAVNSYELTRAVSVCNARANISEVIQQLEIYDAVPKRVDELTGLLMPPSDRRNLKPVFSEWLQLNAWRARILLQVSEALTDAGRKELEQSKRVDNWEVELDEEDSALDAGENSASGSSSEAYSKILTVLGEHFRKVELLGEVIFGLVNNRLSNFFDLAQYEDAGTLVVAVEIVERMDRSDDRERDRRIKGGEHKEKAEMMLPPHKRRQDAVRRLEMAMDARLDEMLPPTLEPDIVPETKGQKGGSSDDSSEDSSDEEPPPPAPSKIPGFLQAASACIVDLQVILDDVNKCFPEDYNIFGLNRWVLERRLLTLLRPVWGGTWASPGDRLQLIGWLHQYIHIIESVDGEVKPSERELSSKNSSMISSTSPSASAVDRLGGLADGSFRSVSSARALAEDHRVAAAQRIRELKRECGAMMNAYIASALPRMQGYVTAILARNNTPERSLEGFLQTSVPEDLFHILMQELSVVSHHGVLGRHMALFVTRGLLRVLEMYQEEQIRKAGDAEEEAPVEWCAAVMNDFERMYDLCDTTLAVELQQGVSGGSGASSGGDQESAAIVKEALDDVAAGFLKGVEATTRRIVDDIFGDFDKQGVLSGLFETEWITGQSRSAATLCATFVDYLDDPDQGLRVWLASELLFGRVAALCLTNTVQVYVIRLLGRVAPFADNRGAAARVRHDAQAFDACFTKYLDSLRFGKIRSRAAFEEKFAVLTFIANTLGDSSPQLHFEDVAGAFGPFAEQAIARLLFLRGDLSLSQREDLLLYDVSEYANTSASAGRFDLSGLPPLPQSSSANYDDTEVDGRMDDAEVAAKKKSKLKARKKIKAALAAIKKSKKQQKQKKGPAASTETIELDMATFLK